MTLRSTFRICLVSFFLLVVTGSASPAVTISVPYDNDHSKQAMVPAPAGKQDSPAMNYPYTDLKAKSPKHSMTKIEELGKIHRFHKERVKKVKKHSGAFWLAAKILLVCCQVALLIHAFLHLSH